jgi:hypothetical protein
MEQDERLYEYKMASEVFRFDARSHAEALKMRGEAIEYFAEHLGVLFDEAALIGPEIVEPPTGFQFKPEASETNRFPGP